MILHSKVLVPKLLSSFSTSAEYITKVGVQFPQLRLFTAIFGRGLVHISEKKFWYRAGRNVFVCKASDILELCEASLLCRKNISEQFSVRKIILKAKSKMHMFDKWEMESGTLCSHTYNQASQIIVARKN